MAVCSGLSAVDTGLAVPVTGTGGTLDRLLLVHPDGSI